MKTAELEQKLQAAREVAGVRAAECNRLREINAELLAALKTIAVLTEDKAKAGAKWPGIRETARAAIARAEGTDQ